MIPIITIFRHVFLPNACVSRLFEPKQVVFGSERNTNHSGDSMNDENPYDWDRCCLLAIDTAMNSSYSHSVR